MKQALLDNSIIPCLVDDYRYLNKGIPNFFDYNIKDKNEAKERQDEKENLKAEIDNGKLYHTQKFKFPFYSCVDRLVAISLAKSYTYDFTTNEIKEVLIIDKINCNLISKVNKFKQGVSNEN
ncbi:hypothetical protein VN1183_04340 [Helicobacter pylori]|nr:hypothetical protein VN1183_04340 [Helicobacter pylori]